jgi:hypothetical protein
LRRKPGIRNLEPNTSRLTLERIECLVVLEEDAYSWDQVSGDVTFSAQPVHEGAVVCSELLSEEPDVVLGLGFNYAAEQGREFVC